MDEKRTDNSIPFSYPYFIIKNRIGSEIVENGNENRKNGIAKTKKQLAGQSHKINR
jgi:hypothetical protein